MVDHDVYRRNWIFTPMHIIHSVALHPNLYSSSMFVERHRIFWNFLPQERGVATMLSHKGRTFLLREINDGKKLTDTWKESRRSYWALLGNWNPVHDTSAFELCCQNVSAVLVPNVSDRRLFAAARPDICTNSRGKWADMSGKGSWTRSRCSQIKRTVTQVVTETQQRNLQVLQIEEWAIACPHWSTCSHGSRQWCCYIQWTWGDWAY